MEEKKGIKRPREKNTISDDIAMIIGSFLEYKNIDELKALKINPYKLIDEIHKYESSFTLEDYLMTIRKKRESLAYILYKFAKGHEWNIKVYNDSYMTKGVKPKEISQLYMELHIENITKLATTDICSVLDINERGISKKYPVSIQWSNNTCIIKLDLDDLTIPNELHYLKQKYKISRQEYTMTNLDDKEGIFQTFKRRREY